MMEKAPLFLMTLALASPAIAESAPARADKIRAQVAQIMAAAEVRATAPLAPSPDEPLSIEDEEFLAGFRASLQFDTDHSLEVVHLSYSTGVVGSLEMGDSERLPVTALEMQDQFSLSREGLGWLIGGTNTRLSVHAAFLRGAAGDPNSASALPTAVEGFDNSPSATAPRQFVLTFQAEIVF